MSMKALKINHDKENKIRKHNQAVTNRKVNVRNVKIQNQVCMDNHERYKNVALGYSIQASRLMHLVQNPEQFQPEQINQCLVIMKKIQSQLWRLGADKEKYDKHLTNSMYCWGMMRDQVKQLQIIMNETDKIVKGES